MLKVCGNVIFNGSEGDVLTGDAIDIYGVTNTIFGNLNDFGKGEVILAKGGKFFADKLSGDMGVSANVVLNGFKDKYVESDALQAKDVNELNLASKSYMFDAKSSENEKGAYDVVLSRKSFNDLIENESVAKFLEDNYKKENNESLYYNLKKADDMHSFSKKVANNLGESILSNFRSENIILYRNLSRDFDEGLNSDEKYMGGYKYVDMSLDDDGNIEGGDVKANVAYGMIKNKKNKNLDYGVGVSIATIDGKYGDKGSRDSKSFGVWVPVKYKLDNGIDISSKLYLGYNDTKYERFGDFGKRKANFDEYQYGINAILSKDIDLVNDIKFNPLTEINLYGANQKGFDEGSINNAIRVDDNNSIIAELGLGAYLKKDIVFDDNSKLGVKLGGIYYVEFFEDGKSFDIEMNGMGGKYSILHRKNMNRAVLALRANYDYNDFSVYGGIEKEFGNNDALLIDVGAKYNF